MKTTKKEVREAIRSYIMECIDFSDYEGMENTLESFVIEYHAEAAPIRGNHFEHWRKFQEGLPSWFNIAYSEYGILQVMEKRFGLPMPEGKDIDDAVDLYYWLIWRELNYLLDKQCLALV